MDKILIYIGNHPKISLSLQPEALVNTSGRVDFSSPDVAYQIKGN